MSDLKTWLPNNRDFWHSQGQKIAPKNLWISVPSLMCAFGIWMQWSVISVQMLNVGYPFDLYSLFSLIAVAGFSGATLRISSSVLVQLCGGRNTLFITTGLLLLPSLGIIIALQRIDTPLWIFQLLALLSGIGGGSFSSFISNTHFFYPKKQQYFILNLTAGIGIYGIVFAQVLIPLLMSYGVFSMVSGEPSLLIQSGSNILGSIQTNHPLWLQNTGYLWLVILLPLMVLLWFGLDNIHTANVTPRLPSLSFAFLTIISILTLGLLLSALGLWLTMPTSNKGEHFILLKELVIIAIPLVASVIFKTLAKHKRLNAALPHRLLFCPRTFMLSLLYIMFLGSFMGFAAAFPLTIKSLFGYSHAFENEALHAMANPNAPSVLAYAWIAPLIGILIHPFGSWIAEKTGGRGITRLSAVIMILCSLGIAYYAHHAFHSITPEEYFIPFYLLFLGLFAASGMGSGSVYHMLFTSIPPRQLRMTLIWMSALAAYGVFYIPMQIGEQIKAGTPERAMLIFSIFYSFCIVIHQLLNLRKRTEKVYPI
ncbi:antiporter [Alteromonas sp. 14N.309.X.WAT.G.H12]|uniref:antiporter n=1 Tax=Alteromonas sp. 14N.309.X.WAT.G.H12 TaxID=3120824 RepID=UPI002FCF8886